ELGSSGVDCDVADLDCANTPLMSSYLLALIAGEYVEVGAGSWDERVPLGIWARKSLAKFVDADQMLEITRAGFAFYERNFGVEYPFTKYDQIFVPEFNAGAMEN